VPTLWIIDVDGSEQLTAGPTELLRVVDSAKFFGLMREFSLFLNENNVIQISLDFRSSESPIVVYLS